MPAPTWTAGLFQEGGADELQAAERRVALLKIELEAIRAGRKEASAAELRKLERDYREAVAEVQQLRIAQRPEPRPSVTPRPRAVPTAARTPTPPAPVGAARGPFGVTTPRGYAARPGTPPIGGIAGQAAGVTTPRGYAAPPTTTLGELWQGRPTGGYVPGARPADAIPGASAAVFGQGPPNPPMNRQVLGGLTGGSQGMVDLMSQRLGLDRLRPTGGGAPGGAAEMTYEEFLAQGREMSDYEKAVMDLRNREFAARGQMSQYQMAQVGQGQQQMRATALYRQQQAEQQQAQLRQAWAVAQAELAHAQNVMASQIGTSLSQQQGQMWAQGLPYALPQGTQVAPGFERGGPMSQLHRMSGSQFRPGMTGRISPNPPPSFGKTMGWVGQAMDKFGAGR